MISHRSSDIIEAKLHDCRAPQGMGCSPSRQHPAEQGVDGGICEVEGREQSTCGVDSVPEQRPEPELDIEPASEPEPSSQQTQALSMGFAEPQLKLKRVRELDKALDVLLASGDTEIGSDTEVPVPAIEQHVNNVVTCNIFPRPTFVPPLDLSKVNRSLRHHISGDAAQKSNQNRSSSSFRERPRTRADWHVEKMRQYYEPPCRTRYPALGA